MVWFFIAGCLALAVVLLGFARLAPDPSRRTSRADARARRHHLDVVPEVVS